jgi:hypothetical protein
MLRTRGLATAIGACAALAVIAAAAAVPAGATPALTAPTQSCNEPPEIPGGPPTALPGTPDATTIEGFAVLRREQQPSDLPPPLNQLSEQVEPSLASYYPLALRRIAALPDGRQYFLITGFLRPMFLTSLACLPPGAPSSLRRLVEAEAQRVKAPVYCVGVVGEQRASIPFGLLAGGGECEPFASIALATRVLETDSSTAAVADIVPDGVATVRLSYRDRIQIAAAVHENGYVFTPPNALVARWRRLVQHPPVSPTALLRKHLSRARRHREEHVLEAFSRRAAALIAPTRIEWLRADGSVQRLIKPHPTAPALIPPPLPIPVVPHLASAVANAPSPATP